MASKKDFSNVNTGRVYDAITEATAQEVQNPRKTYDAQAAQEMQAAGTTQGRKGCRAIRINMAFTTEVHNYIRTMARMRGESITQFTEYVFRKSMEENAELYNQVKALQANFK